MRPQILKISTDFICFYCEICGRIRFTRRFLHFGFAFGRNDEFVENFKENRSLPHSTSLRVRDDKHKRYWITTWIVSKIFHTRGEDVDTRGLTTDALRSQEQLEVWQRTVTSLDRSEKWKKVAVVKDEVRCSLRPGHGLPLKYQNVARTAERWAKGNQAVDSMFGIVGRGVVELLLTSSRIPIDQREDPR